MITINFNSNLVNNKFKKMFIDYKTPIFLLIGGAGSGKSYVGMQKIIIKSLKMQRRVLIVRKVGATLKDSIWKLTLELLATMQLREQCLINKTDKNIILPNGSEFIFKALDDQEKIKSITGIDDIIIEEATELFEEDYTQLKLRLRSNKPFKQIHLFCNPISKTNWIYNLFFIKTELGAEIIHSTYKDNRFLPSSYIKQLEDLQRTNINFYKIYTLGEFATLDKLIFTNFEVKKFDIKAIAEANKGNSIGGIDFGFIDDNAILANFFIPEKKEVYIYNEFVGNQLSNLEIYKEIEKMNLQKTLLIGDSAEPKTIAELRRLGCRNLKEAQKGPDSVIHGIRFLQTYKIYIHPLCSKTIESINNYTWKKDRKTGEYIEQPNHEFSHCMDALRYASSYLWKGRRLETLDKRLMGIM